MTEEMYLLTSNFEHSCSGTKHDQTLKMDQTLRLFNSTTDY